MANVNLHSIENTLLRSNAKAEFCRVLNNDFGLAIWSNQHDQVSYQRAEHHTLSFYLEGGYSTWRLDKKSSGSGAPGKLCILPANHQSDWVIGDYQRFAHLYFSDTILQRLALESFDLDPRLVELPDITYFDDALLSAYYPRLLQYDWNDPSQRLQLQEDMMLLLGDLLGRYNSKPAISTQFRGGLSSTTLRDVIDYIYAHIDQTISLKALARVAKLSEFHFARMFKISTGETVHHKVLSLRVEHARQLLAQGQDQAQIALACGFATQSHFSHVFKRYVGITPGQYQKIKHG